MPLYEHYLPEDYELLTETLGTLHETCLKIIEIGTTADFEQQATLQIKLHTALTTLHALNHKKTQRAEIEQAESIRRHMF
jgi:hypothetical protein